MELARTLVLALEVYGACGVLFSVLFVGRGVGVVDRNARAGTLGFRILIAPGCALLWPWLLLRWRRASEAA
jgi:hypothetical protein